jgi:uncharacterized protein YeaO (DUF488 family)
MIHVKRVYESKAKSDGLRVLVDRLWPRGLTKRRAAADLWLKELAPSTELRKWFAHDPAKWAEFQKRYRAELRAARSALDTLRQKAKTGTLTLLFGAKDETHNEARVLKTVLERKK